MENFKDGIAFDMPKTQFNVIKVIGVGGGGSNAVNYMYDKQIHGVDFVVCNTDKQALLNSPVPNKILLGPNSSSGLGAGQNPEVGAKAAKESIEEVQRLLSERTKMVFITAGMGGGTGTGAAPIIAKIAKDMGVLVVGIVTTPFSFEGQKRLNLAQKGIEELRRNVDAMIVINNNKLLDIYGDLGVTESYSKADEVLSIAARSIAEVITHHYKQNIDLHDAKTVLSNSGTAIMGSAKESGEKRAINAIIKALDSPLLNDNKIVGAKNVLLLIVSGKKEVTLGEIGKITDYIQDEAGNDTNIILGIGEDKTLDEEIMVTIVATGFSSDQQNIISDIETKSVIYTLEDTQRAEYNFEEVKSFPRTSHPLIDKGSCNSIVQNHNFNQEEISDTYQVANNYNSEIKNIEVKAEEVVPKTQNKVYSLDDDINIIENNDNDNNGNNKDINIIENKDAKPSKKEENLSDEELSPLNLKIDEFKELNKARRQDLKKFNYEFKTEDIEKMEKEPAYIRRGTDIGSNTVPPSDEKVSLKKDLNDLNLSKNSFLDDTID